MGGDPVTFVRPDLLALAPAAVLLMVLGVTSQWKKGLRLAEAFGGVHAAKRLTHNDYGRYPVGRLVSLSSASLCLVVAVAGPKRADGPVTEPGTPVDLAVAVDVSLSMSAADIEGTRIGRARELLHQLTEELPVDRMGLSLFADWPYGLVPLTDDPNVVRFFAPFVTSSLVGTRDQGTSLGSAVAHASRTFSARERPSSRNIVLLVTDGEAHGDDASVLDSIRATAAEGTIVWTAGVGTPQGAPLTVSPPNGSSGPGAPVLNEQGQPVIAGYDEELLRTIAELGNGRFYDVSGNAGVRALVRDLRDASGIREDGGSRGSSPAPWLLLIALSLLLLDAVSDSSRATLLTAYRDTTDA